MSVILPTDAYLHSILEAFKKEAKANRYDRSSNRDGKIIVSVAENVLAYPILRPMLQQPVIKALDEARVAEYSPVRGDLAFRAEVASFLTRVFKSTTVLSTKDVTICNGVGTVLHQLALLLFNRLDIILVIAPYYSRFDYYLRNGAQALMWPVHCDFPDFQLTCKMLSDATEQALRYHPGCKVSGVLFTNPSNPGGIVYSATTVAMVTQWCSSNQCHLISDELYGACVFDGNGHNSVLACNNLLDGKVHVLWGFSKDFGISGFRVGALISKCEKLSKMLDERNRLSRVSNHTQSMLSYFLRNELDVNYYLKKNCDNLRRSYELCTTRLQEMGVPYASAQAGMFVVIDLRNQMNIFSWEAEQDALRTLFESAGILLTPGQAQHHSKPGFFRICYVSVDVGELHELLNRLHLFFEEHYPSTKRCKVISTVTNQLSTE